MIQSLTTEALVLSSLMKTPRYILSFDHLKSSVFTTDYNKFIFKMIFQLYKAGSGFIEPADVWARAESYKDGTEKIQKAGGLQYLETIFDTTDEYTTEDIVRSKVDFLVECSCKRDLTKFLKSFCDDIEDDVELPLDTAFLKFEGKKQEILNKYTSVNKPKLIGEVIDMEWDSLERSRDEGFTGITSCIKLLNEFFTYQPNELIVGHAKAKVGKSFFAINETFNVAVQQQIPMAYLDSELSTKTFMVRMLSRISGIPVKSIEKGQYLGDEELVMRLNKAKKILKNSPIYHCFMPENWNDVAVCSKIKQLALQQGIKFAIVDYIKSPTVGVNEKEADILGNFTQRLKDTIGVLNIACLALCQSSVYPTESGMLRIANSRKIECYASTIFYITKKPEAMYIAELADLGGNVKIVITHNRNGAQAPDDDPTCGVNVQFDWNIARVTQAKKQCDHVLKLLAEN